MVRHVAERLGDLRERVVFLGGAATTLLITDEAAPDVRATLDVDVIVEIGSGPDYYRLGESLREIGFTEDASEGVFRSVAGSSTASGWTSCVQMSAFLVSATDGICRLCIMRFRLRSAVEWRFNWLQPHSFLLQSSKLFSDVAWGSEGVSRKKPRRFFTKQRISGRSPWSSSTRRRQSEKSDGRTRQNEGNRPVGMIASGIFENSFISGTGNASTASVRLIAYYENSPRSGDWGLFASDKGGNLGNSESDPDPYRPAIMSGISIHLPIYFTSR